MILHSNNLGHPSLWTSAIQECHRQRVGVSRRREEDVEKLEELPRSDGYHPLSWV